MTSGTYPGDPRSSARLEPLLNAALVGWVLPAVMTAVSLLSNLAVRSPTLAGAPMMHN
jgi:hypothetical protein